MRSVGRKFLVAGRGGLNLTHSEPVSHFPARYRDEAERWQNLLAGFSPEDLRSWAHGLGLETYVGTSGRVFPRGQQAARLLRAWVARLRAMEVQFQVGERLEELDRDGDSWVLRFFSGLNLRVGAVVLALGGASWPETGSEGDWPALLRRHGVEIRPWEPTNCGWEIAWHPHVLAAAEGLPLKNLAVTAGGRTVLGELLVTSYGLEGGALYQLSRELRTKPVLSIDFKPGVPAELLQRRTAGTSDPLVRWKLGLAAATLIRHHGRNDSPDALIGSVKHLELSLLRPRPLAEAISSAGGIAWGELTDTLMLRRLPGVFAAGEMIDWEAPTGGYLLQGCFATGERAGHGAQGWVDENR